MIGIKDLEYMLCDLLDNSSLFSLKQVNKYYNKIITDSFLEKRYNSYYETTCKNLVNYYGKRWSCYYFLTDNLLSEKNIVLAIYKSISLDDYNIFDLIVRKNNINPIQLFNSGKYIDPKAYSYQDKIKLRFRSIDLAVKKDAIICFQNLLFLENKPKLFHHYFYFCVRFKSQKIAMYIVEKKLIDFNVRCLKLLIMNNFTIPNLFAIN